MNIGGNPQRPFLQNTTVAGSRKLQDPTNLGGANAAIEVSVNPSNQSVMSPALELGNEANKMGNLISQFQKSDNFEQGSPPINQAGYERASLQIVNLNEHSSKSDMKAGKSVVTPRDNIFVRFYTAPS